MSELGYQYLIFFVVLIHSSRYYQINCQNEILASLLLNCHDNASSVIMPQVEYLMLINTPRRRPARDCRVKGILVIILSNVINISGLGAG